MPNVFAAVFHPPTIDNLVDIPAQRRLPEMKVAIQQAHAQLSTYAAMMHATNPFFIFLAPEYYFVKESTNKKVDIVWTLYTETEKTRIYEELRALSGRYQRYLIAPGTIAWYRPAKVPRNNRDKDGWSTAPIFYQGELKHEYDKIYDDTNFRDFTADVTFQPGTKSQIFKVESLKFGIEVCGDIEGGNLAKEARTPILDFELMPSATNPHYFHEDGIEKVPVKNGGYFLHADSDNQEYCGAWCVNRGFGSHGKVMPEELKVSTLYDPWTGEELILPRVGRLADSLSWGSVLALTSINQLQQGNLLQETSQFPKNNLRSSGSSWLTDTKLQRKNSMPQIGNTRLSMNLSQTAQTIPCELMMKVAPAQQCLNNTDGSFRVRVTVSLTDRITYPGSPIVNKQITFHARNGMSRDLIKVTDMNGEVSTIFTGNRGQTMEISATFNEMTVSYSAKIASMGVGNVTKMARLQPETVIKMRSYYLPI